MFTGAEAIDNLDIDQSKHKIGLISGSKVPIRAGMPILNNAEQNVGIISSAAYSPTLNQHIALAMLNSKAHRQAHYWVKVRNHTLQLTTSSLPFVPHRYHR